MVKNVADIRNIAICGHGSAGKTTLADELLVHSGAVKGHPSVDAGTSICDFDDEEKQHHHSIEASLVHFDHAGKHFNLLDTPGYPELVGQMIGALRAVETALIVIDAHAGVKVNTRRAWEEASRAGCGRILVLTKLDAENIDFAGLVASIKQAFGPGCIPLNIPLGVGDSLRGVACTLDMPANLEGAVVDPQPIHEALVESIIEADEAMMERYFAGEMPSDAELSRMLAAAIAAGTLTPIVCVSAKKNIGVDELLELLSIAALSPIAVPRVASHNGDTQTLRPDASAPLAAQVFKTRIDPFVQRLSFLRVFAGTLKRDVIVHTADSLKGFKLGALLEVQGGATHTVEEAGPGDIVAVAKCDDLHTGATIGDLALPPNTFPTPMVGLAVAPKNRGDEAKLSGALHKITEEDQTIHLEHDPETKEMVLTGMSELHLQLTKEKLKRRDHVEIETHEPKIPYRETVQSTADGSYRHKKQSGGSGQFAEIHARIYPFPEGADPEQFASKERFPQLKNLHYHKASHFLWVDTVVGGTIPGNFMPAIEKGFLERIKTGVVAGYPIQNVCVEVYYGKDHPVDSNETAFRIAASKVFAEIFKKAKPALLEPVVNLHINVPANSVGDVSSDLSGRRGQMVGMESSGGNMTTVEARIPLAEVTTYARTLSSMTGGQGSFTMEFSHYDVVPGNIQQAVMSQAKLKEDED